MSSTGLPPLPPLPPISGGGSGFDANGYPSSGSLGGDLSAAAKCVIYEALTGKVSDCTKAKLQANARKTFPGNPDKAAADAGAAVDQSNSSWNPGRLVTVVLGLLLISAGIFGLTKSGSVLLQKIQ